MMLLKLQRRLAAGVLKYARWPLSIHRNDFDEFSTAADAYSNNHQWSDYVGTKFVQLQLVNALHRGDRQRASRMLLNLVNGNVSLSASDFTYILEYCAQAPDPLFVLETWKVMEEKAIEINKRSGRFIIQAFSKAGYIKEAFNWLNFLGENDRVEATLQMFNIFLSGCMNSQSLNYVGSCLELMEGQFVGKSEVTYWELLKLAVLQKNLSAVHEIWKDYIRYYSPSIITMRKFIWSFNKLGDLESAHAVLKHMILVARGEGTLFSVSSIGRYQSSKLDIPIPTMDRSYEERFWLDHISSSDTLMQLADKEKVIMDISSKENQLPHAYVSLKKDAASKYKRSISNELFLETTRHKFSDELEEDRRKSGDFATISGALGHCNSNSAVNEEMHHEFSIKEVIQRDQMTSRGLTSFLRWSFNDMIHACTLSNNYQLAEQLFLQMLDVGLVPSRHTYNGIVKAAIDGKGIVYGTKMVQIMQKKNIEPYNDTLAALSIGHSKNLDLDLAEEFLDKISENVQKYIHAFNTLLAACNLMDELERAVRILAKIKHLKVKPNIRTYELMFLLFGNVNVPYEEGNLLSHADVAKRISTIEMDMMKNGFRHSYISLRNLVRALGAEGMIPDMLRYLHVAENMLCKTDAYLKTDMYNDILHALVDVKESHKAIEVFLSMRFHGLPANVATYNIMIECCSIPMCFKSASALISLMLRDGFYLQKVTYTSLIKVLLAAEDFDGALNLLDQSTSDGIELDIVIFNTILREAYSKGRIGIIELIIEHIHREKIQPDPSTLWYTFCAYVECGFHSTALEALQVLSIRMISEEDEVLQEKKFVFEELIHSEDLDAELQIIETFKDSQEYLATALMNLRWCAILGCSISWHPEESKWSKRLSLSYTANKSST